MRNHRKSKWGADSPPPAWIGLRQGVSNSDLEASVGVSGVQRYLEITKSV